MESIDIQKINQLIRAIEEMIDQLNRRNSLEVHKQISQSYYMLKAEELRLLSDQFHEAQQRYEVILGRVNEHYKNVFCKWKEDVKWLNTYTGDISIL